jgi:hypothetical protein
VAKKENCGSEPKVSRGWCRRRGREALEELAEKKDAADAARFLVMEPATRCWQALAVNDNEALASRMRIGVDVFAARVYRARLCTPKETRFFELIGR